jgi:hypothetical protein
MSAFGVIPPPEERRPRPRFVQTGEMDAGTSRIVFGAEGQTVVIVTSDDIVLGPEEQDLFARHYFRAVCAAEARTLSQVPF